MLVADTTAIVHLHVPGPRHAAAMAAYRRDPDWLTVPLWRYEFVNVLWKIQGVDRQGAASFAASFRQAAERMGAGERSPDDMEALHLASSHKITAYDAYYVALAQKLKLSLLTEDRELLAKFPRLAISLADFAKTTGN